MGLFNGTSGVVVIINIEKGTGVYITASQTTKVWISSKQSFEVYFNSLTSLQILIDLHVGTSFTISSASSAILEIIGNLLVKLSSRIAIQIQGNAKLAITILVKIASSIRTSFTGSLRGFLKVFGSGLIVIYGDILWLVSVFEGLALFFSKVTGGLTALIKANVELNIALLLGSANGVELLVNLLLAIVARVDLSIVAALLNSVETLIKVIVQLGGDQSTGITGVFRVISNIIAFINGSIKIDVLIGVLIEYGVETSSSIDISISIKGLKEVIRIQESLHSSTSIKAFITFVEQLESGSLIVRGINISKIITVLIRGAVSGVINLVVIILLQLTAVIKAVESIASLLLHLLGLLNSRVGIRLLQRAIPGISIKVTVSGNFDIFAQIFASVNVVTISRLILTGFDINTVLTSVPVLGQIYKAVSTSVSSASSGSLSLTTIVKSSAASSIVSEIRVWFKAAFHSYQSGSSGGSASTSTSKSIVWHVFGN